VRDQGESRRPAAAQQVARLEALQAVTTEIAQERNLDVLLQLVVERAATALHGEAAGVWLLDTATERLTRRALHGGSGAQRLSSSVRLGEGLVGHVAARREGQIVQDYAAWPGALPELAERIGSATMVAEPILSHDRLLGVLVVAYPDTARPFARSRRRRRWGSTTRACTATWKPASPACGC
jgi:signal transduction protein with GAF and PtsI domain